MADYTHSKNDSGGMDRKLARPWWWHRGVAVFAAITVLAGAGGMAWTTLPPPSTLTVTAPNSLDIGEVARGPFQDYVALRAGVVPLDVTYITAASRGQVAEVVAQDGDPVAAGQVLARLDNPDLVLEVASREAEISSRLGDTNNQLMALRTRQAEGERALADAEYALHKAQEELQKYQRLREQNVANDANVKPHADEVTYQAARVAALKRAQGADATFFAEQTRQIEAQAADLRRSLAEVRHGLDGLVIRAAVAGRLTGFSLKPGQAVAAGETLGEVDSENAWKLSAEVDEFYLARLAPGLQATANLHGQATSLRIAKVYPQVHDGRVTVEMIFDGEGRDHGGPADLKRGEAIDLRLSLGKTQEAIVAPAGAWLNDSNGAYAFVLNARGDGADRRTITTGRRNPEQVETLGGLAPGERIITGPLTAYAHVRHLRFRKDKSQ